MNALGPFKQVSVRGVRNEYRHVEFEGPSPGTRFANDADEVRLEAVQNTLWGWDGAIGLQYGQRDFETVGDEAFVPATDTREEGVFLLQERSFGTVKAEIGVRR